MTLLQMKAEWTFRRHGLSWPRYLASWLPFLGFVVMWVAVAPELAWWQMLVLVISSDLCNSWADRIQVEGRRKQAAAAQDPEKMRASVAVLAEAAQKLREIEGENV